METPVLKSENRFWALTARPFNKRLLKGFTEDAEGMVEMTFMINVSARETLEDSWAYEALNEIHTVQLKCPTAVKVKEDVPCQSVTLAFDEAIDAPFHRVEVTMVMVSDDLDQRIELGDVALTLSYGSANFAIFGIALNIVFLVCSLVVFLLFVYKIRPLLFHDLTYEQFWTLILVLGVVFYNSLLILI